MKGTGHNACRTFVIGAKEQGVRLDAFLASKIEDFSRSQIQKLNKKGLVLVEGASRADHYLVKCGEKIEVSIPIDEAFGEPSREEIPIKVVYEDEDIVVVNKDAGLVVHPAHGHWQGTLVNALLGRGTALSNLGGPLRPGIVHRLDKDTSGLIAVAKSDMVYEKLTRQIQQREFRKIYHAIIWGSLGEAELTVEAPIGRHPVHRQKMTVLERKGKEAATRLFVVDSFGHFEYIRVTAYTGRTHQIRVHLSHISHPVLGDPVYGGRRRRGVISSARTRGTLDRILKMMKRQALHASGLSFEHPKTGRWMNFRTALPGDMRQVLETLYREDWIREVAT